ncbi:MAG: type II toxin-antitoxin system HicA family toxin [Coprothermobacterota bacterium]|nr:type II toxin-antitoxin system HicA family toxin [Coprothermobacterota bacterium]
MRELISFLSKHHFESIRQKGSHLTLWHPILRLVVTIPVHPGRTLGRGLAVRILKRRRVHRRRLPCRSLRAIPFMPPRA